MRLRAGEDDVKAGQNVLPLLVSVVVARYKQ